MKKHREVGHWKKLAGIICLLSLLSFIPAVSHGAPFSVTKTADTNDGTCDADCSLREAITAANADGVADTISVPAGTYTLTGTTGDDSNTTGDLDITNPVHIIGAGSGSTIIQAGTTNANGIDRVFHVTNASAVTIEGATVRYGRISGNGGCIYNNSGTLTFRNSTIDSCYATDRGGAVYNLSSDITLDGIIAFTNNSTQRNHNYDHGAAIWTSGSISHTTGSVSFENNIAWSGGAIWVETSGKTITLNDASFLTNSANNDNGGAIRSYGITITNGATFADNYAADRGGAIYNTTGDINISGTTLFDDNDTQRNANTDHGGAIWTSGNIVHSGGTITFQDCSGYQGGAIWIETAGKTISLNAPSFLRNTASTNGGAMRSYGLTITGGATFTDNYAGDRGGAIYNTANDVTIDGTAVFTNNDSQRNANTDHGGAIWSGGGDFIHTNGSIDFVNNDAYHGGAVYMDTGSFTAVDATFTTNSASGSGGGVFSRGLTITGGATFTNNNAPSNDGGAIYNTTNPVNINGPILFDNNDAGTGSADWGGAIYSDANVVLNDISGTATFQDSQAYDGGAVYMNGTATFTAKTVIFTNNTVGNSGGAMVTRGLTITDGATFTNNKATNNDGGAIFNTTNPIKINGTILFDDNDAGTGSSDWGGAIYSTAAITLNDVSGSSTFQNSQAYEGGAIYTTSTLTATSATFADNWCQDQGGALYMSGGTLTDVTFTNNYTPTNDGGAIFNNTTLLTINGSSNVFTNNYAATGASDWGGSIYSSGSLTISNAAFTCRGGAYEDAYEGGAIYIASGDTLTLSDSSFENCRAHDQGGAIYTFGGVMNNVTFTGCESDTNDGGAILNDTNLLTISGTNTFTNNKTALGTDDVGGAIYSTGSLTISGATFTGNSGYHGGAIFITDLDTLSVSDSTFDTNTATTDGGAIYSYGGTIDTSTFVSNSANDDGGGIYSSKTLKVINSTFSANDANDLGGGMYQGATCTVKNSTYYNNTAGTGEAINGNTCTVYNSIFAKSTSSSSLCTGVTSGDYNIQHNGTCFTAQANDQVVDPLLVALADNGGSTKTHALQTLPSLSPAVDTALNSVCADADVGNVDQRGETRPTFGGLSTTCDIGTLEYIPLMSTIVGTTSATVDGDTKIDISMPYTEDGNSSNTYTVKYKLSSSDTWLDWGTNPKAHVSTPYTDTITGLIPGETYDVQLTYNDADEVTGTNPQFLTNKTLDIYSVDLTTASQTVWESVGTVTVTATISIVSGATVTVPFTVTGTADDGGTDHNLANGNISVTAGQPTGNTTFTVTNDTDDEPDETVIVTMGTPTNATIGTVTVHTVTIEDNDIEPHTPINSSPANGATDTSRTPTLTASAYGDTEGNPHQASRWQIATDANFTTIVYDTGSITDLENHVVAGSLEFGTTYYWRVRYQDDTDAWSSYSSETVFTTLTSVVTPEYVPDGNGYIKDWLIIGSFGGSGCGDITNSYIDEANDTPNAGDGPISGNSWVVQNDADTYIDFSSIYGGDNKIAYAAAYVYSPTNRAAQLRIGSDDGFIALLNGSQVGLSTGCRGATPDNNIIAVTLNQGWNRLILKVMNGTGGWGFYCRFTDTGGTEMIDLDISLTYNDSGSAPNRPTNTTPTSGATDVSVTPTLASSAFSDTDGDSHAASRWQIRKADGAYGDGSSYDSSSLSTDLTSHTPADRSWLYTRTITLSSATAMDDYQVKVVLDTNNFDYSKAKADGADLRFFDPTGNQLTYWIERWDNTDFSIIWVKVASSGTASLTLKYGNAAANALSDGFATFDFFDDFNDGDYTSGPAWNVWSGTWTVNATDKALQTSSTGHPIIYFPDFYDSDYIVEARIRGTSGFDTGGAQYDDAFLLARLTDGNRFYSYGMRAYSNNSYWLQYERNGSSSWGEYASHEPYTEFEVNEFPSWYKHKIQLVGTSIKAKTWKEAELEPVAWGIDRTDATYPNGKVGFKGTNNSALTAQYDDVFVRKYAVIEPTATVGAESLNSEAYVFSEGTQYYWQVQHRDDTGIWSLLSAETAFTTKANGAPNTPTASSPSGGATVSVRKPTLTSSAYSDTDSDAHRASQWRVSTVSGDYDGAELVHDSTETTTSLVSYDLPVTLTKGTTYFWQVWHQDVGRKWSAWSTEATFVTGANLPPYQPTNSTPTDEATGVSRTPALSASPFSDDGGDTHKASRWQVTTDNGFSSVVYDTGTISDLIGHTVSSALAHTTTYYWRVRYLDNDDAWSAWSDGTSFTTIEVAPDGAIAYWAFNAASGATAIDSAGNYDGTIVNGVRTTEGKIGRGVILDGGGDYVTTPFNFDQSGAQTYTIELWVYPFTTSTLTHWLLCTANEDRDWGIYRSSGTWYVYAGNATTWNPSATVTADQWQHLVLVYEPGIGIRFYNNGVKTSSSTLNFDWDDVNMIIGSNSVGSDNYFDGIIDEVVIYDRALTDAEVTNRYNLVQAGPPAQPTNQSPANGATDQSLTPSITADAFSDPNSDEHRASRWQLRPANLAHSAGNTYDSGVIFDDLTSHTPTLAAWSYRKPVTINPATPMDNYQVRLDLTPETFEYNKAKSDGADIRFYDASGEPLNFWIESWNDTGTSTVWIKVPTSGTTSINMYYGNAAASTGSNGAKTFDFFDDFSDGNYTSDPLWVVYAGTWTVTGGVLQSSSTGYPVIQGTTYNGTDYIVEAKIQYTSGLAAANDDQARLIFRASNKDKYYGYGSRDKDSLYDWELWERTGSTTWAYLNQHLPFPASMNQWYKHKVQVVSDNIKAKVWLDGETEPGWGIDHTDTTHDHGRVGFQGTNNTATVQFDDIFVRKYTATEPAAGLGSEVALPKPFTFASGEEYYWHVQYQDVTGSWSPWSFETGFTTRTNVAPTTPTGSSPTGAVSTRYVTLSSSAFSDDDVGEGHQASQWRVSTTSATYSGDALIFETGATSSDLTSHNLNTALDASTTYYWQVRHQDTGDLWSDWSIEVSFTTDADLPPRTPTNLSPTDEAIDVSRTPLLSGSPFSDDSNSGQQASQWQISTAGGAGFAAAIVYDSGPIIDKTSHTITTSLDLNTTYYWRVRYQDISDLWSAYSTETRFTTSTSTPSGVIVHWKLDHNYGTTAYDSVGSNHGEITNATWTTGNTGSALNFDGSGDYVTFSDFTVPETFSVTMWVNPTTTTNGQCFLGKNDSSGNNIFLMGFWNDGYEVSIRGAGFSTGAKVTGWQQLAVVVEKISVTDSTITMYKNGAIIASQTLSTVLGDPAGRAWTIGQEWDGSNRSDYYNGKMDEVIIYNRALTNSEVQNLHNNTTNISAPDQPTNSAPANTAVDQSPAPTFSASAFNDADGHTHTASQWRVRKNGAAYGDTSNSYGSGVNTDDLTSHILPTAKALPPGTVYYWQVKYRDSSNQWSAWSAETNFAVRANNPPNKPTASSPIGGATVTTAQPTLTSSAFSDPDTGDAQGASQWRVSKVSTSYIAPNLAHDSGATSFNLTSYDLPINLNQSTTYYWQVRHQDIGSAWSAWSDEVSFITAANLAPDKPVNSSPTQGAGNISRTPTLTASAFNDVNGGDSHQASQWQISTDTDANFTGNILYDSGQTSDLVSHTVSSALAENTIHYWRVRYQDNAGNWSSYSDETMFTTETSLSSSIKLHWKFDDGSGSVATDAAGNHNGTITDATWTDGRHNGALVFDGYNDRVTTSFASWQPESFSVEFWINPASCTSNSNQRIYSTGGWDEFYFHTNADCSIYVGTYQANRFAPETEPDEFFGALDLKTWQHFVFTYSAGTGKFYKNGALLGSKSMTKPKAWTSFNVGRTVQYTMHGKVDDVIVYTRALSPAEVLSQYDAAGYQLSTPPNKPSNLTPTDTATGIALSPTLTASAFADPDSGASHGASRWRIRKDSGSYGDGDSYDTNTTAADLSSLTIGALPTWADGSWSYRKKISLSPATSVADYQIKIELTPISFDYSLAKSDGSDLRFFTSAGAGLNYYIKTWDTGSTSTIWVKVADSGTDTIYMYYGNSGAGTASDPDTVFDLYDGFDGTGLDTAKWDTMNSGTGTTTVSGGLLTIASGGDWWNTADTARAIVSKTSFGTNFIAETKVDTLSSNNWARSFGLRASAATNSRMMALRYDDNKSHINYCWRDTDGATAGGAGNNTGVANKWWPGIAKMVKNGDTVTGFYDGSQAGTRTVTSWGLEKVSLTSTHATTNPYKFDWLRVRKYMATAPVAVVGAESLPATSLPLEYGTTYQWHVQYEDETGTWSEFSDETDFTTVNDTVPDAPTGLTATINGACRIDLTWTDVGNNETDFRIERKIGAGSYVALTTVAAGVESYSDTSDLTADETHFYKVYAVNSGGDSTASNEDSAITTSITYYQDFDSDTYGNNAVTQAACTVPDGYVTDNTDCDDTDALLNPATIWYLDADGDEYSSGATLIQCTDPGGTYYPGTDLLATSGDCNDSDVLIHPALVWYKDVDGDDYSDGVTKTQCTAPADYYAPDNLTAITGDCNDTNAAIKPGATEICDGKDNDCDGNTDEGYATDQTYYRDADSDTFGDPDSTIDTCQVSAPSGYTANSTDCNDGNAAVKPGATEYCNSIDDDCNNLVDDSCTTCEATPSAPTVLNGSATNSRIITLTWIDNSTCEDGFELEIQLWNGEWALRATTGPGVNTFTDTIGIMPETTYTYRVRAFAGSDNSTYSNEKDITTPAYTVGDKACE